MYLDSSEYNELKSLIAQICSISKNMTNSTLDAFNNIDKDLAKKVMETDKELDKYCMETDDLSGQIIALHWPRGSDMRYIISIIKITSDFERIGDHCKRICKQIRKLSADSCLFTISPLKELFLEVNTAITSAAEAFYTLNIEKAEQVAAHDAAIDVLKSSTIKAIIQYMGSGSANLRAGVNMINIARRLERMADHAKNISEAVNYTVKGKNSHKDEDQNDEESTVN